MIYTFWEGHMPEYVKLCLKTWHQPYEFITYSNLHQYTDFRITDKLKRYTLPQIADCVRVHVLRDNGGYWLDADTIMLGDLPEENIAGEPDKRTNSIGFLHTEKDSPMFREWADYQEKVIDQSFSGGWDIMGNRFTDGYVKHHKEITICNINEFQPERAIEGDSRREKYERYYFGNYEIPDARILMLHNSWTPKWYSRLTREEVLNMDCTLSNILKKFHFGI